MAEKSEKQVTSAKTTGKKTNSESDSLRSCSDRSKEFEERFVVSEKKLGSGSFGDVMRGYDKLEKKDVAVKIETKTAKSSSILAEGKLYSELISQLTEAKVNMKIPHVIFCSPVKEKNILVMEMLGQNLEELLVKCHKKFTLKTTLQLADQLLDRIELIHTARIMHRDIKPENFLIGPKDEVDLAKRNSLRISDFGLSKMYYDRKTGKHIPIKTGKELTGTARYASVHTHNGLEQSRRDDIEAIGHMLLYFAKGSLPWMGLKLDEPSATLKTRERNRLKYRKIGEAKRNTNIDDLCQGLPDAFKRYMKYARHKLEFTDRPDYENLRKLFRSLFENMGYKDDNLYDWDLLASRQQQRPTSASKPSPVQKSPCPTTAAISNVRVLGSERHETTMITSFEVNSSENRFPSTEPASK